MVKDIKVVIGANYGDEGKGLMTDYFANKYKETYGGDVVVICTNGGAQRGHTVVTPDDLKHVFHHFGSGTFAGADTYFPRQFIVNPMIFMKEYRELIGLCRMPVIRVNPGCLVSTPYDMLANMVIEESRGANRHGSVGVGIWETLVRSEDSYPKCKTKTFSELKDMSDKEIDEYLLCVLNGYYTPYLANEYKISFGKYSSIAASEELRKHWIIDFRNMSDICYDGFDDHINLYDCAIFENAQGLLLDKDLNDNAKGIFTTPSKTDLTYVKDILENVPGSEYVKKEAVFVTRSYLTKHGAGSIDLRYGIPYGNVPPFIRGCYETNVPNDYQGTLKYATLNKSKLFERMIRSNVTGEFTKNIAVTHCDEYETDINIAKYKSYGPTRNDVKEKEI